MVFITVLINQIIFSYFFLFCLKIYVVHVYAFVCGTCILLHIVSNHEKLSGESNYELV